MPTGDDGSNLEHVVVRTLQNALTASGFSDPRILDEVVGALIDMRLIAYSTPDTLSLLTASGRLLALIMDNPGITIREIAVKTGTTEANVQRTITKLREAGLIQRQIVKHSSHFFPSQEAVLSHPDVVHMGLAIMRMAKEGDVQK